MYVKNLVTGICRAIDRAHESGTRSYFFTDGPETSWSDFGGMIARAFGNKPFTLRVPQLIVLAIAMFAGILSALGAKTTILSRDKNTVKCAAPGSFQMNGPAGTRITKPAFSTEQGVTGDRGVVPVPGLVLRTRHIKGITEPQFSLTRRHALGQSERQAIPIMCS